MLPGMSVDARAAEALAERCLAGELPQRWTHVRAAAATADRLRPAFTEQDADTLVAAVWLHDIGYAASLHATGFHPLDGARYLRSIGLDARLCALVAHHSGARHAARMLGLTRQLSEFPDETSLVRDALWFCDLTTGPTGRTVTFDDRLTEVRTRYGPTHVAPRSLTAATPDIRQAIEAVHSHLHAQGLDLTVT
jgi:predicted metal-dependent HD superfamily phosphohydrolase